jgi:hypothetical protein
MPPLCSHCGRAKGSYGPAGYCSFTCKVEAKRAAAQAKPWVVLQDSHAPRNKQHSEEGWSVCMTSAVFDQWQPAFPPADRWVYPWTPQPRNPFIPSPKRYTPDDLRELLDAFHKALEAAEKYDEITGQPDCEDAEKAKLLDRVAELEERLAALEADRAASRREQNDG